MSRREKFRNFGDIKNALLLVPNNGTSSESFLSVDGQMQVLTEEIRKAVCSSSQGELVKVKSPLMRLNDSGLLPARDDAIIKCPSMNSEQTCLNLRDDDPSS